MDVRIQSVQKEGKEAVRILFDIPKLRYLSGQYLILCPQIEGKEYRRAYSLYTAMGYRRHGGDIGQTDCGR